MNDLKDDASAEPLPPERSERALQSPGAPPARSVPDRRSRPTPMISRFLLVGRRRGGRRDGERENIYVDQPGAWIIAAFLLVALLSVADAYFTLHELSLGATEANPV